MMKFFSLTSMTVLAVSILTLSGCAATKPNYHGTAKPKIVINDKGVPSYYRVRSGDSVSKISERYGLNYRAVGQLNGLDSKYTIYAGQWLKLWNDKPRTPPKSTVNPEKPVGVSSYQYPSKNAVTKEFQPGFSNGMWFSGKAGDPVFASKAGTVIYAGDGLSEFGNLVMIRHTDELITVYAHNSRINVQEGSYVQQGQQIAAMGKTGATNEVGLQFQVRNNGTPINPRRLLGNR